MQVLATDNSYYNCGVPELTDAMYLPAVEFIGTLENFEGPVWGHHIPVTVEIAKPFIEGDNRRVICTLMDSEKFHAGLMPMGEGEWFVNVNKPLCTRLGLVTGQEVKVKLEKDRSDYGMAMPEELYEMLLQDEQGWTKFHALTPGKQRNLIYIVSQTKNPDIRLRRALVVVNHIKNHDQIDFKKLNEEMTAANRAAKGE